MITDTCYYNVFIGSKCYNLAYSMLLLGPLPSLSTHEDTYCFIFIHLWVCICTCKAVHKPVHCVFTTVEQAKSTSSRMIKAKTRRRK